jgi:SAM-dependent methyltransferase
LSIEENARSRSWYLDPLAARQKQAVHLELLKRWAMGRGRLLKTDVFEEANGADQLLLELGDYCDLAIGFDQDWETVARASFRCRQGRAVCLAAADVRSVPLRANSIDLVLSTSTLDHFPAHEDFAVALQELARVLRPGGLIILTLDNPLNLLYWPLRWFSAAGPFRLGFTPSPGALRRYLELARLDVIGSANLIHNPRIISTLLFLGLRRILGKRADSIVGRLLYLFALLERLPTRRFTCCFYAVAARKRNPD